MATRCPSCYRGRVRGLVLAAAFGVLIAVGCSGPDLPDGQLLVSPHFRYHARAETVLDPTITDRLERHRDDVDGRFGVAGGVVDYYLFRDVQDLRETMGTDRLGFTVGRSVFTSAPFYEHELAHALLADAGQPSTVLEEGVAQWSACLFHNEAGPVPPSAWPAVFNAQPTSAPAPTVYDLGQRLVAWMVETSSVAALVDFYAHDVATSDPAAFDARFQSTWSRRIEDVLPELAAPRFARSSCACAEPPLADGATFIAGEEYRVLDVPEESRLELSSATGVVVLPGPCDGADNVTPPTWIAHTRPLSILAHVAAGKHRRRRLAARDGPRHSHPAPGAVRRREL